jgi:hypothetical protein
MYTAQLQTALLTRSVCRKLWLYNQSMKTFIENFILQIPYPLLRKVLYIYVGAVFFWSSAPNISMVLWIIILITLAIIGYQSSLRKWKLIHAHSSDQVEYAETGRAPFQYWAPRILLNVIAAVLGGYFLNGQLGLNSIQIFLLIIGYPIFYRETGLLGAYVAYLITKRGIGIEYIPGHIVYQTFIGFDEIKSVNIIKDQNPAPTWSCLTPLFRHSNGLLLIPCNPNGFSAQDRNFFIAPKNMQSFLKL